MLECTGNAFEDTSLDAELRARQVGTVIVCGLVTHGCVQAACRGAQQLGYRVVLVADAHSNWNRQARQLIEKCNRELAAAGITVAPAEQIQLGAAAAGADGLAEFWQYYSY